MPDFDSVHAYIHQRLCLTFQPKIGMNSSFSVSLYIINKEKLIMNIISKTDSWRKNLLLYRFLRFRKGFGVHSPFAFAFITKVIDERWEYYCYQDIELIRKQLMQHENRPVRQEIKRSHGELLFRVVNYFKPRKLIQFGSPAGIGTLYMASYASGLNCLVLEENEEFAQQTRWSLQRKAYISADIRQGDYRQTFPEALQEMDKVDFIFFNSPQTLNRSFIDEALKHIHPDSVFFIEGIRANKAMRQLWKELCTSPQVVLTFDLYNIGILFFNPRLQKRNYIVYF